MKSSILIIDVAHPPRHPDDVEDELLAALSRARNATSLRVLKIIHGHGSSGLGGSTKTLVRNWAFRNRSRFRAIIEGESYSLSDAATQELRKDVGQFADQDLGRGNPGVTILWMK